jgi:hypothetical protein
MKILTTAAGEAQETIGKGLVDAFKILAGTKTGIEPITKAMADLSQEISDTIVGLALFIKKIKEIPIAGKGFSLVLDNYLGILKTLNPALQLFIEGQEYLSNLAKTQTGTFQVGMSVTGATDFYDSQARAIAKAEADALAKKLAADKKAAATKIKTDKAAAANKAKLDKAAAVFELQKIQIAAALKGKISEEEKTRLLLMQAIEEGNADKAEDLAKKLEEIQAKNAKIAADLLALGATKDPFSTWAGSLDAAIQALKQLGAGMLMIPGVNFNPSQNPDRNYDMKTALALAGASGAAVSGTDSGTSIFADNDTIDDILTKVENAAAEAVVAAEVAAASVTESQPVIDALIAAATNGTPGINFNPGQNADRNFGSGFSNQAPSITINIEGNVLDGDDFTEKVNDALLNANRTGMPKVAAGTIVDGG